MPVAPHNEPGNQAWYRSRAATFTAGGAGAVLVAALVVTVVQFSDEWGRPETTVLTTVPTVATTTETRDKTPFIITPSDTSSSFPTSVSLSTSDFGLPPETTSSTDTTTSSSPSTESSEDSTPTTTRKRPRLNETRTGIPRP